MTMGPHACGRDPLSVQCVCMGAALALGARCALDGAPPWAICMNNPIRARAIRSADPMISIGELARYAYAGFADVCGWRDVSLIIAARPAHMWRRRDAA